MTHQREASGHAFNLRPVHRLEARAWIASTHRRASQSLQAAMMAALTGSCAFSHSVRAPPVRQVHSQHVSSIRPRHPFGRSIVPRLHRHSVQIACTAQPPRKDEPAKTRKVLVPVCLLAFPKLLGPLKVLIRLLLQAQESDPTPFFEPLLRSFVLGLGTGALFEASHVSWKVSSLDRAGCAKSKSQCLHSFVSPSNLLQSCCAHIHTSLLFTPLFGGRLSLNR